MGRDYRYNIKFNPQNGRHVRAAEILDSVGARQKAQLVAEAIVAYTDGEKSEHVNYQPMLTREDIRKMVEDILHQKKLNAPEADSTEQKTMQPPKPDDIPTQQRVPDITDEKISGESNDVVDAVLNGLKGFI